VLYQTSERAHGSQDVYEWSEEYPSRFWRDGRGAYTINPSFFMPMVRNVPLFPEGDVRPGDAWTAPGSEVHDFRENFGIAKPFGFPITVSYTYTGNEDREGSACAVFAVEYEIFHPVPAQGDGAARMYPVRVAGYSRQKLYWDLAGKRPQFDAESFDFIFSFNTGDEVEYKGESEGRLIAAPRRPWTSRALPMTSRSSSTHRGCRE
jgi:hypothetical protein